MLQPRPRPRTPAAFAIPGDIETISGGYIYERRLLEGLRDLGHEMDHLRLADSFPDPTEADLAEALARMAEVARDRPLIVDGFLFGTVAGLDRLAAPVVGMVHHPLAFEVGLSAQRRAHLHATEKANVAAADRILVPSAHTRDILVAHYDADPARIRIAPPGVDRPRLPRRPETPPMILSVGILHPRKGHDVLLDALSRVLDLDWRAVIVGSDYAADHAADLRARAAGLGLGDRVAFAGEVPPPALERLFAEAAVFALATRYEGYGMVFAEALVRGLPVVATRAGAVPDTVPEGAGRLVPPADPAAFAEELRRMLVDEPARRAQEAAALRVGRRLPHWHDTAAIAGEVLDALG